MSRDRAGTERFTRREQVVDRALRLALGPVGLPPGAWDRLAARLVSDSEISPVHRKGDPVPVLAAIASFCLLFQVFLATDGSGVVWTGVGRAVQKATLLVLRWADRVCHYLAGR